jgi:hypothetical protein
MNDSKLTRAIFVLSLVTIAWAIAALVLVYVIGQQLVSKPELPPYGSGICLPTHPDCVNPTFTITPIEGN